METGNRISDYVLFQRLANTAFGESWRAGRVLGTVVERHVLLQLFNGPELDSEGFWGLVADRRGLMQTVRDPHLASCLAFDRFHELSFSAYAFRQGRSLKRFFEAVKEQKLPVPLDQALFIIERVAIGLTAAHATMHRGRPVAHGFLVPDLIRLTGDGEIEVVGLEAAPGLRNQFSRHPAFAPYLAPEAQAGEPPADTDDVYSLGALLFQLLCGIVPPRAAEETVAELLDDARLAAGGDPLPPVITSLLEKSLSASAERIPDSATWQQVLSRIILDGEHNPTTFNLSFLMHTVFREELDREGEEISHEQGLRISPVDEVRSAREEAGDSGGDVPLSGDPTPTTQPSFLAGFAISFAITVLLLAVYFLFFRSPDASADDEVFSRAAVASNSEEPRKILIEAPAVPVSLPDLPPEALDAVEPEPYLESEPPIAGNDIPEVPNENQADTASSTISEARIRAAYEERLLALANQLRQARESALPGQPQVPEPNPGGRPVTNDSEPVAVANARSNATEASIAAAPRSLNPASNATTTPRAAVASSEELRATDLRADNALTETDDSLEPDLSRPVTSSASRQEALQEGPPSTAVSVDPPSLEKLPQPVFPSAARRLKRSAKINVRLRIDASGRVASAELTGPEAGFGFDAAALNAAKRSKWRPAMRNGVTIEAWANLTIDFRP